MLTASTSFIFCSSSAVLIGRIADQKAKFAAEMPKYTGVPEVPVSVSDLIRQQQEILARNGSKGRYERVKQLLSAFSTVGIGNFQRTVFAAALNYDPIAEFYAKLRRHKRTVSCRLGRAEGLMIYPKYPPL